MLGDAEAARHVEPGGAGRDDGERRAELEAFVEDLRIVAEVLGTT